MSPYLKKLKKKVLSRRKFILGASATVAAGSVVFLRQGGPLLTPGVFPDKWWNLPDMRPKKSSVAVFKAANYEADLVSLIKQGIDSCQLVVKDKTVLLKPNLVEFSPDCPINTNPKVVMAAIEAFRSKGAHSVIVAEGAGHRRDTELLLEASGLGPLLREAKVDFLDLNLDDVIHFPKVSDFMDTGELFMSRTLAMVDIIVSMPKLKTHHWVGATLGMKNLFGCIPGAIYGWPKNVLHWCGINESIVDIAAILRPHFTIVDGIIGMEGNGPINGTAKPFGALIMGTDVVAVDSTCVRLMGLNPEKVKYLAAAGQFIGNSLETNIIQLGEPIKSLASQFSLPPHFEDLINKNG